MLSHHVHQSTVLELPSFFSKDFCASFLQRAAAAGFGEQVFYGDETRERAVLDSAEFAQEIWEQLPALPDLATLYGAELRPDPDVEELASFRAVGLNARLRFYRYFEGARFSRHHDITYEAEHRSFLTLLVYLNEGMTGGETCFDDALSITPRTGSCVLFPHELMHQGNPVTEGTKVVLRTDVMYAFPY
ncbi:MAG: 2OG-Fe(II) oxygenase [Myxococcota bacterium]|nr:2OG-Fe(II) oxygenase [Myxococcota bacterium]